MGDSKNKSSNIVQIKLAIDQPFDLPLTLESGQAFRWHRVCGKWNGFIKKELVTLQRFGHILTIECNAEAAGDIAATVYQYFRFDDDLDAIYNRLGADERLIQCIQQHWGLRILRQDPWECLIAFICSQNSNIMRIAQTQESLAGSLGNIVKMGNIERKGFPTPEILAAVGEESLRNLSLGYRAKYVARTAEIIASGKLALDSLREASYHDAKTILMELPGVGAKVADCVLLFALDKLEAIPIDRWVRRAFEEWYLGGEALSYDKLLIWAHSTFGFDAGYAQQYLFMGRRQIKDGSVS